jgi:hypothetical protein
MDLTGKHDQATSKPSLNPVGDPAPGWQVSGLPLSWAKHLVSDQRGIEGEFLSGMYRSLAIPYAYTGALAARRASITRVLLKLTATPVQPTPVFRRQLQRRAVEA